MRALIKRLLLVVFLAAATLAGNAQSVSNTSFYAWPSATSAGIRPISIYSDGPPASYTIDAATTGTAPTTCTFEVESSPDAVTWNNGTGSLSGVLDCHLVGLLTTSFLSKPVRYLRINLLTLTGGDATTKITFSYTRGF